jgi:hypothetical protein
MFAFVTLSDFSLHWGSSWTGSLEATGSIGTGGCESA